MQIELILNDGQGESILLPPTLALDDFDASKEIPGAVIPGRAGRRVYSHLQRLEPVTLRASGTVECFSKEEADEHAAQLRGKLLNNSVMWLKRYDGADKYIKVRCTRVNHNYHRGHFGARVYSLNITFVADDPYWYSNGYAIVNADVIFTPPITMLEVENRGTEYANPIIRIHGKVSGSLCTHNFRLTNYTTGAIIQYEGDVKEDELLILDTSLAGHKTATLYGQRILDEGSVRASTDATVQLSEGASSEDDVYKNHILRLTDGAGAGQHRKIIGYNGESKVAIIENGWDIIPDLSTSYAIHHSSWAEGYQLYEAQTAGGTTGVNVLGRINSGYLIDGFPLAPGLNRIEAEEDNELLNISIIYKERWK